MAQSTAAASPTGARRAAVGEPLTPNLLAHNLVHVKDDVIREKYVCLLILIVSIRFCKPPALLYIYFTDDARLRCWGKLHLCSSPQTQRIKEPTNRITTPYKKEVSASEFYPSFLELNSPRRHLPKILGILWIQYFKIYEKKWLDGVYEDIFLVEKLST